MKKKLLFITGAKRWNNLVRKFRKIYNQIISKIKNNSTTEYEYNRLIIKLQRIYQKLEKNQYKIGIKLAGTALSLMLATSMNAQITFEERVNFPQNQFGDLGLNPATNVYTSPAFVDIDNDGDFDAFSIKNDSIKYSKNIGTIDSASFSDQIGSNNPFNDINIENNATISFSDIDSDGDFDAFIGNYDGTINYYKNIGDNTNPSFIEQVDTLNIFNSIDVGFKAALDFVDIDNDGDFDAFIGNSTGEINFLKNTGTNQEPIFEQQTGANNPLNGEDAGGWANPDFVDIDNDGDLDLFVGNNAGDIKYYKNTGTLTEPTFEEQTELDNPLYDITIWEHSTIDFVDIDNDGDFDLFVGDKTGKTKYYKNIGGNDAPIFADLNNVDVGNSAAPKFADIDNDGDFDAVIGNYLGQLTYYKNAGTNTIPELTKQDINNNPFKDMYGLWLNPEFADIDNDGDLDIILGNYYGTALYYKNTGTITEPIYTEQTGANNPFDEISEPNLSDVSLIDLDNDGDLDLVIGEYYGTTSYYKNTGTNTEATFEKQIDANNPFANISHGLYASPAFGDIDNDGDLDLVLGTYYGDIKYYENTGTNQNAEFTLRVNDENPFQNTLVDRASSPTFIDIDNDGDLDLFIGNYNGEIKYFENTSLNTYNKIITSKTNKISVYPNPSHGIFTIDTKEKYDITITNIAGKIIANYISTESKSKIDLSNKSKGIYFIKLKNTTNTETLKVLVK